MTPVKNDRIRIRPIAESDSAFLARAATRLFPGTTASPRDPVAFRRYFELLTPASICSGGDSRAYVAELDGVAAGVVSAHLDVDYFTSHPRPHIDTLAVAAEAEGRGIGRALIDHMEVQGRSLNCCEIVLDVFATNTRARKFYEQCGFVEDHIRMAKTLELE